jgi:hypothetical protein
MEAFEPQFERAIGHRLVSLQTAKKMIDTGAPFDWLRAARLCVSICTTSRTILNQGEERCPTSMARTRPMS